MDHSNSQLVIVFLERHEELHETLKRMVRFAGYKGAYVYTTSSDQNFIAFLDNLPTPPTVIFTNLILPSSNGYKVYDEVRINPKYRDTRIILYTGGNSPEEARKAKQYGFDGFLGKPVSLEKFAEFLERTISGEHVWEIRPNMTL